MKVVKSFARGLVSGNMTSFVNAVNDLAQRQHNDSSRMRKWIENELGDSDDGDGDGEAIVAQTNNANGGIQHGGGKGKYIPKSPNLAL